MAACFEWFQTVLKSQKKQRVALIFNCSPTRNPAVLLAQLVNSNPAFSDVFFTTFKIGTPTESTKLPHPSLQADSDPERHEHTVNIWKQLCPKTPSASANVSFASTVDDAVLRTLRIADSLPEDEHLSVLVTGSLWLVGAFMQVANKLEKNASV